MTLAAVCYIYGEFKLDHRVFMGKRTGVAQLVPLVLATFPFHTIRKLIA
jgi:hypothetical protein